MCDSSKVRTDDKYSTHVYDMLFTMFSDNSLALWNKSQDHVPIPPIPICRHRTSKYSLTSVEGQTRIIFADVLSHHVHELLMNLRQNLFCGVITNRSLHYTHIFVSLFLNLNLDSNKKLSGNKLGIVQVNHFKVKACAVIFLSYKFTS